MPSEYIEGCVHQGLEGNSRADPIDTGPLDPPDQLIQSLLLPGGLSQHKTSGPVGGVIPHCGSKVQQDDLALRQLSGSGQVDSPQGVVSREHLHGKRCTLRAVFPHKIFQLGHYVQFGYPGTQDVAGMFHGLLGQVGGTAQAGNLRRCLLHPGPIKPGGNIPQARLRQLLPQR